MKWRDIFRRRLLLISSAVLVGGSMMFAPIAGALRVGGPSDCDNNAVVRCGVHTINEVTTAYNNDAYVRHVYGSFGITPADIAALSATAVSGRVTRQGKVFINGHSQPVATGAMTGGRQNMPGSTPVTTDGFTFYQRPPSASFRRSSLPAFVVMKDGRFQYAIIASCGNAVSATPVTRVAPTPKPAPTRPTPAPAQQQQQQQQQQTAAPQEQQQTQQQAAPVQQQQQQQQQQQTTVVQQSVVQQPAPVTATVTATPAQPVTKTEAVQPQPSKLVDTGPGALAGLFTLSSLLGVIGYRHWLTRRLSL